MTTLDPEGLEKAAQELCHQLLGPQPLANINPMTADSFRQDARQIVSAYLGHVQPVVDQGQAERLPDGSVIQLRDGTIRLRTSWGSGWASATAGDDYPLDLNGDFPATVIHRGDR